MLQKELNYWQNTTINILKKYLLENEGINISLSLNSHHKLSMHPGTGPNHCAASDDSYIKDGLEKLDHKIESIHNATQGKLIKQCQNILI